MPNAALVFFSVSGEDQESFHTRFSCRILKHLFSFRLLKKVQMQGDAPGTHPQDGCRCEAYLVRTPQRRASAPTPQMGLFQQPAKAPSPDSQANGKPDRHEEPTREPHQPHGSEDVP